MLSRFYLPALCLVTWECLLFHSAIAQYSLYKVDSRNNILDSASTLASDMMRFYKGKGNGTGEDPGLLPEYSSSDDASGYPFGSSGAMMATYIDYWHLTGDSTYNKIILEGMLYQRGNDSDYLPDIQLLQVGNEDQLFWGLAAMTAAEVQFVGPPEGDPQWIDIAENVWNEMAGRIDDTCGGGLRMEIFEFYDGWDYKIGSANAAFFALGARLARFTGNDTFAKVAEDTWGWMLEAAFIDQEDWSVYEGAYTEDNCTDVSSTTWSEDAAMVLQGLAFLYNSTDGDEKWGRRLANLQDSILDTFFVDGIAYEASCEGDEEDWCPIWSLIYKGVLLRSLASVIQVAPQTKDKLADVLRSSAEAAVEQCTGGDSGRVCGFYWSDDENYGPQEGDANGGREALNVLAAVSVLLVDDAGPPNTQAAVDGNTNDGNSDLNAGTDGDGNGAATIGISFLGCTFSILVLVAGWI